MMPSRPPYDDEPEDEDDDEIDPWATAPGTPPSSSLSSSALRPSPPVEKRSLVLRQWAPHPLPPPCVDAELIRFGFLERSAEVFRYSFQRAEYWLSPGGGLREWVRLNVRLAVLAGVPAILVAPLVTLALGQISTWVTHLTETTSKMVLFPLTALLIIAMVCALVHLSRLLQWPLLRRSQRYQPRAYYDD